MAAIIDRSGAARGKRSKAPIPIKPEAINQEAERNLLGKLFRCPEDVPAVLGMLDPADFFDVRHQTIFEAFSRIQERGDDVTPALVDEELTRMAKLGLVQQVYVHELERGLSPFDDAWALAGIVLENAVTRQERAIATELAMGMMTSALAIGHLSLLQERRLNQSRNSGRPTPGMLIDEVEMQSVSWLWHRRLARGKVTILDGDPGVGKGFLTLDISARISRGWKLPHDPRSASKPGNVLLFTPEDDVADTIRPRLEAAGADLHRIRFLASVIRADPTSGRLSEQLLSIPRDIAVFEDTILREGIDLLVVDPITAVLDPGVKTNNDMEVRVALMPLAVMAARTGCAVLIVRHLNKSGGDNALYRGGGSIGFVGLARVGLMLTPHPDGDAKRVLAPVKSNIGRMGEALSFSLEADPPDAMPHVVWDEEVCEYDTKTLLTTRVSDQRREIIQAIKDSGTSDCSPSDVAQALGFAGDPNKESSLRNMMAKMKHAGALVSRVYGKYSLPDRLS